MEIFIQKSMGIMTKRDHISISYRKSDVLKIANDFSKLERSELEKIYSSIDDSRDWNLFGVKKNLYDFGIKEEFLKSILYSPFDFRNTYYTNRSRGFIAYPVYDIFKSIDTENIAITTIRKMDTDADWDFIFSINGLMTHHALSMKEGNYVFPMSYINNNLQKIENLRPEFRHFIDNHYDYHYGPEEIMGYIYAIIHTITYRTRYAQFLKIDFPRIPFAPTRDQFETLSNLGWSLIQAHLLKAVPRPSIGRLGTYRGKGDHRVEAVRYSPEEQTIWINRTQGFAPVPQAVWDFHIGGYQVLDKYLKSRKDRTLNLDEQTHIGEVAESLAFTIDQMAAIDLAYRDAFPFTDEAPSPDPET